MVSLVCGSLCPSCWKIAGTLSSLDEHEGEGEKLEEVLEPESDFGIEMGSDGERRKELVRMVLSAARRVPKMVIRNPNGVQ